MAKAKRGGKSYTSQYASYTSGKREASNRLAKLTKLAKENPNNLQIVAAMRDIHHRRNKPKAPHWSHQTIALAKVVKYFTGKFDKGWLSIDPLLHAAATRVRNEKAFSQYKAPEGSPHLMFNMKERAHTKEGVYAWK